MVTRSGLGATRVTLSDRGTKDSKVEDTGASTMDVNPCVFPIRPHSTSLAARELRENQCHSGIDTHRVGDRQYRTREDTQHSEVSSRLGLAWSDAAYDAPRSSPRVPTCAYQALGSLGRFYRRRRYRLAAVAENHCGLEHHVAGSDCGSAINAVDE